jgi:hypothetical protein
VERGHWWLSSLPTDTVVTRKPYICDTTVRELT